MMMQMIHAGGVQVVSDGNREADENNPKGYFEDDRIKKLHQDNSWVGEAQGKGMKVIAQLLKSLPKETLLDTLNVLDKTLKSLPNTTFLPTLKLLDTTAPNDVLKSLLKITELATLKLLCNFAVFIISKVLFK